MTRSPVAAAPYTILMAATSLSACRKHPPISGILRIVDETDDLLVITDDGTIIRVPVAGIRRTGRSAQGVRIMRLSGEAKVICVEKTEHIAEEEQPEEPAAETAEESPDAE